MKSDTALPTLPWLSSGSSKPVLQSLADSAAKAFLEPGLNARLDKEMAASAAGGSKVFRIGNSLRELSNQLVDGRALHKKSIASADRHPEVRRGISGGRKSFANPRSLGVPRDDGNGCSVDITPFCAKPDGRHRCKLYPDGDFVEGFSYGEYAVMNVFVFPHFNPDFRIVPDCLTARQAQGMADWLKKAFVRTDKGFVPQRLSDKHVCDIVA